jgi:hypothetical protein
MGKQPYIPFYVGDYLKDTRILPLAVRGAWVDLILFMWDAPVRGELIGSIEDFARLMSCDRQEAQFVLSILKQKNTADFADLPDGQIRVVSRKMRRDANISEVRAEAGRAGGKSARNTKTKRLYNQPGYIYIIIDDDQIDSFKVGISANPQKRLLQLKSKTGRNLKILFAEECPDMGLLEDNVLIHFNENRDGEWFSGISPEKVVQYIRQNNSKTTAKQQQITESEYEVEINNKIESPSFEDFWKKYDKKVGRGKTEKLWAKISQDDREKIMDHLNAYVKQKEKNYRKDPERYLRHEGWKDEVVSPEPIGKTVSIFQNQQQPVTVASLPKSFQK